MYFNARMMGDVSGFEIKFQVGTGFETLDLEATGFALPKLQISYAHPRVFSFRLHVAQHTRPIPHRAFLYVKDGSRLIFDGHVFEIKPVASNIVEYVCYDPSMRARNEVTIMSANNGNPNVIPRRVYNAKMLNDDDYLFEYSHDANVGSIIADILTDTYNELLTNCDAAPLGGGIDAFVASDLTGMDYISQEKIVFESELLGSGIDRLLNYYPAYRCLFIPSITQVASPPNNQFRFFKVTESPELTLTLNAWDYPTDKIVLSLSLSQEMTQRYTAVSIYGPQQIIKDRIYSDRDPHESASAASVGLTKLWSSGEEINFTTGGPTNPGVGNAGRKWQITDADKRLICKVLPGDSTGDPLATYDNQYNDAGVTQTYRLVNEPVLQVTYDDGLTWWTVPGIILDRKQGIIWATQAQYKYQPAELVQWKLPDNVRFVYAYFYHPLQVRVPSSGFEGTCYTVAGSTAELKMYDEMYSIAYIEGGTPYTTPERTAQYEKLAQNFLDTRKDIAYTGGCVIDGIDYDFIDLNLRINFTALDNNNNPIDTGWEAAHAILTDVEYDYENQTTTLTFSSDLMQFSQQSIDQLRKILGIHALQLESIINQNLSVGSDGNIVNSFNYRYLVIDNTGDYPMVTGEV